MSVSTSQFFWPRGPVNRAPYWVFGFMARAVQNLLGKIPNPDAAETLVLTIIWLIILYMYTCLFIGRLHDIDRSEWWALPIARPLVFAPYAERPHLTAAPRAGPAGSARVWSGPPRKLTNGERRYVPKETS